MAVKAIYTKIQGANGNPFVTEEFTDAVEKMADRLGAKPEFILAAMSFETGGSFNPGIQNSIGATGLIQFLKGTAKGLGTTTDKLKAMTPVEQLEFVEKYFNPFKGKLDSLEAVYTAILSGSPKKPDDVLFRAGTKAYAQNPLDWNDDGEITAREAATPVAARLYGGIERIQKRLLELDVVPAELKPGFVDRRWGMNTSIVVAAFQRKMGLTETGLMDVATGNALFPDNGAAATVPLALKRGDTGDKIEKLQDALVGLGYLRREDIGSGHGTFGPLTEAAVKAFQKQLGIAETGTFGPGEQTLADAIAGGIGRGSSAVALVRALQNRLVAHGFLTQAQVDTGFGTFGPQTEAAVRKFQKDSVLPESGVVEGVTFRNLFNETDEVKPDENEIFTAKNGEHYDVASDILMTKKLQAKLAKVADLYFEKKNEKLTITSGYRPPPRQAQAIFNNIKLKGETKVRNTYVNKAAIDQILASYRANKSDEAKAVAAMTDTITKQVARGVFISNHLLSNAIDIRVTADFVLLGKVAGQVGGRLITEGNHFHMELT